MDITGKAKELGKMIAESEEMANLKKYEAEVAQDQRAGSLLGEYKRLQLEMVKAARENREKQEIDSIKEMLLSTQDEINKYDITRNYLESKSKFDKLMKTINDVIIFSITGEEPCSPAKCGSCGGGCK
ncbi:MAG: YlbF family regulator [Clostridia bacterium]|nr:YlbF family regulator [Clostridia bacterium]